MRTVMVISAVEIRDDESLFVEGASIHPSILALWDRDRPEFNRNPQLFKAWESEKEYEHPKR